MSEVPKFVRLRLQQPAAGEHPDANLLAAFAEGALTQREREQVMAHLASCDACREVVSLALPEVPAAAPAAVHDGKVWARWPMLRWAGVAAAVVIVAAVVIQKSRRDFYVSRTAKYTEAVAKPAEPKPAEAPVSSAQTPLVRKDQAPANEGLADRNSRRAKQVIRAEKKKDVVSGVMANAAPPQANVVRQSNEPAESQSQLGSLAMKAAPAAQPQVSAKAAAPFAGGLAMEQSKQQQLPAPGSDVESVRDASEVRTQFDALAAQKAKAEGQEQFALKPEAVVRPQATPNSTKASGGPMMKTALATPMHWRVSAAGTLERSTDAGQTWQFVRVGTSATMFRSFAAVGSDLWAGGAGGALYHSPDNGRTWTRIVATAGDATLESDIARVDFTDAQHGTVTTTSGETWTTADGGATWSVHQ